MTSHSHKGYVLVVDDNPDVAAQYADDLRLNGYKADIVTTGTDAVSFLCNHGPYDFILVDQYLPDADDGFATIKAMRTAKPDARIIMMTMVGDPGSMGKALESGADRYILLPPFSIVDIIDLMEALDAARTLENDLLEGTPLRSILDRTGIGVSIIDRSYRILYLNQEQETLIGKKCHIGSLCWAEYNFNYYGHEPCPWCPTRKVFEDGKMHAAITASPVIGQDNSRKMGYYLVVACPIFAPNTKPSEANPSDVTAVVEFVRDVTEEQERELKAFGASQSSERLYAILGRIQLLGFSRVRLYELSDDGTAFLGLMQVGDPTMDIKQQKLSVSEDGYSRVTLDSISPQIYQGNEYGDPLLLNELNKRGEDGTLYVKEWMDVPLRDGEQNILVGKLSIDNRPPDPPPGRTRATPRSLTKDADEQLMVYAAAAAREIVWERNTRRMRADAERLTKLRELAVRVADSDTLLTDDMGYIVRAAAEISGSVGCHLRLVNQGRLEMIAGVGPYYKAAQATRPIVSRADQHSGSATALRTARFVVEPNAQSSPSFSRFIAEESPSQYIEQLRKIHSYACIPLVFDDKVLGVINFQAEAPGAYGPTMLDALFDFAGAVAPLVRVDNLMTQLREAQEQLTLGARSLAHQINGPHFTICETVANWKKHQLNGTASMEEAAKLMERIGRCASNIGSIKENLSTFLRGPLVRIAKDPIDINALLFEVVDRVALNYPGVCIKNNILDDLPCLRTDPNLMERAIEEIVTNACRAIKNCKKPTLSFETSILSSPPDDIIFTNAGSFIQIVITDNGPGLPKEAKAFTPFFTNRADGSGLGLSIVKQIIKALGGWIWEEGSSEIGARFVLLFPTSE